MGGVLPFFQQPIGRHGALWPQGHRHSEPQLVATTVWSGCGQKCGTGCELSQRFVQARARACSQHGLIDLSNEVLIIRLLKGAVEHASGMITASQSLHRNCCINVNIAIAYFTTSPAALLKDFQSAGLKNKKHWNSFTTPCLRHSHCLLYIPLLPRCCLRCEGLSVGWTEEQEALEQLHHALLATFPLLT